MFKIKTLLVAGFLAITSSAWADFGFSGGGGGVLTSTTGVTSLSSSAGVSQSGGPTGAVSLSLDQAYTPTWTATHVFNGKVGFNVASPAYGIDVDTSVFFNQGAVFGGSGSSWTASSGFFQLAVGSGTPFNMWASSGYFTTDRLGIGISNPATTLSLGGTTAPSLFIQSTSTVVSMNIFTSAAGFASVRTQTVHPIHFGINSAFVGSWSTQGHLGVGTTTPSYRLHVSSAAGESGVVMSVSTGTTSLFQVSGSSSALRVPLYVQQIVYPDGTVQVSSPAAGGGSADGTGNWTALLSSNSYVMGNVGIGTSSPSSKLEVAGDGTKVVFYSSGIVSIGRDSTTTSGKLLHLALPATNPMGINIDAASGYANKYINASVGGSPLYYVQPGLMYLSGTGDTAFQIQPANATGQDIIETFDHSGNSLLQIKSSPNSDNYSRISLTGGSGLLFQNMTDAVMSVSTNSNVGVGTTNPLYKLHVSSGAGINATFFAVSTGPVNLFSVSGTSVALKIPLYMNGNDLKDVQSVGLTGAGAGVISSTPSVTITANTGNYVFYPASATAPGTFTATGLITGSGFQGSSAVTAYGNSGSAVAMTQTASSTTFNVPIPWDYAVSYLDNPIGTNTTYYVAIDSIPAYGAIQFANGTSSTTNCGMTKIWVPRFASLSTDPTLEGFGVYSGGVEVSSQSYTLYQSTVPTSKDITKFGWKNGVQIQVGAPATSATFGAVILSTYTTTLTGWAAGFNPGEWNAIEVCRNGDNTIFDPSTTTSYGAYFNISGWRK
jgi:hypothetical protein